MRNDSLSNSKLSLWNRIEYSSENPKSRKQAFSLVSSLAFHYLCANFEESPRKLKRTMKQSILFVCLGNICRSCTAEEIFRVKAAEAGLADQYEIDSAGLIDYHEGELPDARMRRVAQRHGYTLTHRSRPVVSADFEKFDYIVAMDLRNREKLERMAQTPEQRNKIMMMADYLKQQVRTYTYIPDPYYGTERDFELVVELLEDACTNLLYKTLSSSAKE